MSKFASVVTAIVCLGALGACTVNTPPAAPAPSTVVVTPPPPTVTTPGTVVVPRSY